MQYGRPEAGSRSNFRSIIVRMRLQILKQCCTGSPFQQNMNQYHFLIASMRNSIWQTKTGSRNSLTYIIDRNKISRSKTVFLMVAYTKQNRPTAKRSAFFWCRTVHWVGGTITNKTKIYNWNQKKCAKQTMIFQFLFTMKPYANCNPTLLTHARGIWFFCKQVVCKVYTTKTRIWIILSHVDII